MGTACYSGHLAVVPSAYFLVLVPQPQLTSVPACFKPPCLYPGFSFTWNALFISLSSFCKLLQ